jgi:predicted negative regulator of RcsB-dependent stress response
MAMAGQFDFEEQERIAELKAWWEDNRLYVIGAIVAAVLAFAGWQGWKQWSNSKAEDAAMMFVPVSKAARAKDAKGVEEGAKALIEKHPGSFHASEAALFAAKAAFDAGKNAEAREKLDWVVKNGAKDLQGVARLRLAAVLLDEKKYPEALTVLDGNKDEAFTALAADLRGDVMLAQGRLDEARASYKMAIDKAEPRNPVKQIAEVKLNALGGAK